MTAIDCYGVTHPGIDRASNQDHFLIADLVKTLQVVHTSLQSQSQSRISGRSLGKLLLVADGMGGHNAGQRASELAIESVNTYVLNMMHWLFERELDHEGDFEEHLKSALTHSNAQVRAEAEANPQERNMGTTLTMGYIVWSQLYVVHAGDSRCYLYRDGCLDQITTDHTFAQEFVDKGILSPEVVDRSPFSHYLWNVVGGGEDALAPHIHKRELWAGDKILFCTDGLTRCVSDDAICEVLQAHGSSRTSCEDLLDRALQAGGPDNITVLVASVPEASTAGPETPNRSVAP